MKKQIETTTKLGLISEEIYQEHKGFKEWTWLASKRDHQTILQVLPTFYLMEMNTSISKSYICVQFLDFDNRVVSNS